MNYMPILFPISDYITEVVLILRFPDKNLLSNAMRTTCPINLSLFHFIVPIIFGDVSYYNEIYPLPDYIALSALLLLYLSSKHSSNTPVLS